MEITPEVHATLYSLITHWSSAAVLQASQASSAMHVLQTLGTVTSDVFVAVVEDEERDRLREDRLQRQWTLDGHS